MRPTPNKLQQFLVVGIIRRQEILKYQTIPFSIGIIHNILPIPPQLHMPTQLIEIHTSNHNRLIHLIKLEQHSVNQHIQSNSRQHLTQVTLPNKTIIMGDLV
jgi:hypothetical protein